MFEGMPILCWTIDDWKQFDEAIAQERPSFNLSEYLEEYRRYVYQSKIDGLFSGASIKLNLGGDSEKVKITTTERPTGIFDFSLAAKGLYRVQEYYSDRLEKEFPDKFALYNVPKGVVPPNLVKETVLNGEKTYYYEDKDGYFILTKQQKGTAAIEQNEQGAKLKFATKTKKVYLNYKRKGGKVRYAEIYSIFYYPTTSSDSLQGDVEFAIRHIPALMVAEYLEKMGVMTRFYMTRFVQLNERYYLKSETDYGAKLPMYDLAGGKVPHYSSLFVQPIIAKDFGEEMDRSKAFMISSDSYNKVYNILATYAQKKEVSNEKDIQLLGKPIFSQEEYFVGIERYRNKYQQYVEKGLFKSKEILPEAMLFFHDKAIANHLREFSDVVVEAMNFIHNDSYDLSRALLDTDINPFFSWWMKLSASTLKDKINIINSNELVKDIVAIRSDAQANFEELTTIYNNIPDNLLIRAKGNKLKDFLYGIGLRIMNEYGLVDTTGAFKAYILKITNEITTYAENDLYATDDETIEKRDALSRDVTIAVSSL
jgi:hypothetical protein